MAGRRRSRKSRWSVFFTRSSPPLLVAIAFGQIGVKVSPEVKTLAFALFIYALGCMIGPQFVSSLGRATLKQAHLTLVSSVVVVITVWAIAKVFGYRTRWPTCC